MTETPCVFVDVQRGGPSTGLPTLPGAGRHDAGRWGSHGDYEIIALCPNSPQECFDLTIKAFNLAEKYRVPVIRHDGRSGRPHDREGGHPAGRRDRGGAAPAGPRKTPGEYQPYADRRRHGAGDGARPATATASTSPA